jgi:hypothetical protein
MKAMYETFQDRPARWVKGDQRLIVGGAMLIIILLLCVVLHGM